MHDKPITLQGLILLLALVLDVAIQPWFGFSFRAPRCTMLAVAIIGLRWGSIAGGYWGAAGGLVLALHSGELPFAATAALAAAGWIAGEIPGRFAIESYRAIGLALAAVSLTELAVVCLVRGIVPPGGLNALVWTIGWAVIVGPLPYRAVVHLSTPPPAPHVPTEPE